MVQLRSTVGDEISDNGWVSLADAAEPLSADAAQDAERGRLAAAAWHTDGDVSAALTLALQCGPTAPLPGGGTTSRRWELLATLAAGDVGTARVVEAHLDALAILAEAGMDPAHDLSTIGSGPESTWGVFAAEGAGLQVLAERCSTGTWSLRGVKPWCSLADQLSHALITAQVPGGARRLFAVALQDDTVRPTGQPWFARGLSQIPSTAIELSGTPAVPVGADGWYLTRPGFAWGGAGVAACWFGGAVGVALLLRARVAAGNADQIALLHLGAVDVSLAGVRALLTAGARQIDTAGAVVADRIRAAAAAAAEEVVLRSAHALGPAPLALDDRYARRVADLQIYIRQHHAERDLAALGRAVLSGDAPW